jgi:hypothetical protein
MAIFSEQFPRALHVLPLHALRSVLQDGALLAKAELMHRGGAAVRVTTSRTDAELGLCEYVHFYLCGRSREWEDVPLLGAQLLGSGSAPFPHLALEMATRELADAECTLCLWNAAVSRPAVEGYCLGGNWTRGTAPSRIIEVWQRFRETNPDVRRARGHWNDPVQLPTVRGDQIRCALPLLRLAPRQMPELLLRSRVAIRNRFTLWVFSKEDLQVVHFLDALLELSALDVRIQPMPGYEFQSEPTRVWRAAIAAYFSGQSPFPAGLDFDRKR